MDTEDMMTLSRPLNILITTPQWQSALACIQSMGRQGHRIFVWGDMNDHPHLHSSLINKRLPRRAKRNADQVNELGDISRENAIDIIIPVSDTDALIAAHLNESRQARIAIVGSVEAVSIARDRNRTAELCRRAGLPFPDSVGATAATAERLAEEVGYPCFIKLSGTEASQGVARLANRQDLRKQLEKIPQLLPFQIQKEIVGNFVGVTGVAADGVLLDSFAFEADYKHSHGGTPPYAQECKDGRLADILAVITRQLEWTGGLDLDLLRDAQGRYYVLEINPRLSGTTVFPDKLGIDLPKLYVDIHSHRTSGSLSELRPSPRRDGGDIHRFVSLLEEAFYLRSADASDLRFAKWFRHDHLWRDNAFWSDEGYSQSLFEKTRDVLLSARRP